MLKRWQLTGRDSEADRLRDLVERRDPSRGILVTGTAGVGKTRLVAETVPPGPAAVWVVGTHTAQDLPLGAFSDWVGPGTPHDDPAAVLHATADSLLASVPDTATVVVDDVHLLDPLSAALIQRVVLGDRARVVLTARSGSPLPEPVAGLWKDGWLERMDLAPLAEDAVRILLHRALGDPMETHSLRRLITATGGSTLFLRELVEGELASGGLELLAGKWYWKAPTAVPATVVDLVRARLDTVPDDVRRVCELLAQTEPLSTDVLAKLTSERAVEDSESHQLTTIDGRHDPVMVRLQHPLYGDALRAATPSSRARRLREELGDVLDSAVPGRDRRGDIAPLQRAILESGSEHADVGVLLAGATVAFSWYDFALTERLATATIRAGGGFPARLMRAGAVVRQGRIAEAIDELAALLAAATDPAETAMAGSLLACVEFWVHGDVAAGRTRIAELAAAVSDPALSSYLNALRGCFAFFAGEPDEAWARSEAALGEPAAEPNTIAWAAAAHTITDALAGRTSAAVDHAIRGNAAVEDAGAERFVRLPLGNGEVLALGLAGELDQAERRAIHYEELTQAAPGGEMSAAGSFFRGQSAWWRGDLATARSHLEDALTELADFDSAGWTEQAQVVLAQVLAAQGDPIAARKVLDRLDSVERGLYPVFAPLTGIARAWVAAAEGAAREAGRLIEEAATLAERLDQSAVAVLAWHSATRWGMPVELARLRAAADSADGPRGGLAVRHAESWHRRDAVRLDAVAQAWLDLGALGVAADTAAQAAGLHRAQGAFTAAQASAHTARSLAERTGARTPAILTLTLPDALTRREREIATLAATGLSNAAIAHRLVLSERTVEGHLNHAYAKLHIGGRKELGRALGLPAT